MALERYQIISKKKRRRKNTAKKVIATIISAPLPFIAAIGRGFMYSSSALAFFGFCFLGTTTLSLALISGPFFPLVCVLGITVILASLGMEGRATYKTIRKKMDKALAIEEDEEDNIEMDEALPLPPWKQKLYTGAGYAAKIGGGLVVGLSAITKITAATCGTITILSAMYCIAAKTTLIVGGASLVALGPPGIAILCIGAIVGLAIGSVVLGKEGRAFYKLASAFGTWLIGKSRDKENLLETENKTSIKPQPKISPPKKKDEMDQSTAWQVQKLKTQSSISSKEWERLYRSRAGRGRQASFDAPLPFIKLSAN